MKQSTSNSAKCLGGQSHQISQGSLVILQDHPEGQNKFPDKLKYEFVDVRPYLTLMYATSDQ